MWVIKLGGSVTHYESLMQWLKLVVRWGDGKVILVPGGGVYADAVREFQRMRAVLPEGHIDDGQAHALAIYAMDQMARSLVAMMPELTLVRNPFEIAERGWQHRGLVWLPSEMALGQAFATEHPLPQSWDITSDSLAAWLALQLDACQLLMIKSDERLKALNLRLTLPELQEMGIMDTGLTSFLNQARYRTWVMHQSHFTLCESGFDASQLARSGVLSV